MFQTLDTPPTISRSLSQTKALLEQESDDSDLSEPQSDDEEFEDVVINGTTAASSLKNKGKQKVEDDESSVDEDWEDALGGHHSNHHHDTAPVISGDIELTLSAHPTQAAFSSKSDGKKGPSKIERHIRNVTHCMHVQFLMFHNLIRNSWIQDKQVQKTLVENMTTGCWKEMDRYWRDSGITDGPLRIVPGGWTKKIAKEVKSAAKWKDTGTNGVQEYTPSKGKDKAKASSSKVDSKTMRNNERSQRDWGATSDRLEPNSPNLSAGNPLLRLLKYLTAYWKAKFRITAPCLRKRGYLSPSTLEAEITAWREHISDADAFGERVDGLAQFRELARKCEGSRDVGQQLFTALLRGLGIEARMVASLQPVGFGWSQAEEGKGKNLEKLADKKSDANTSKTSTPLKRGKKYNAVNESRYTAINISDDDTSDLSSAISISSDSELNVKPSKKPSKSHKYGDELPYPTYWTEAISHLTHTPIAVSPLPRSTIATTSTPDALLNFYSRGAVADKAKQVFAYLIAFSSDGTAKDVTTRYLPKHQWPGKTKGLRMPVEKIPIHNKRGKVKRWEEWDWFKSVLRPYARAHIKRQPWDEIEDEGDLVPRKPEKPKDMDEDGGKETLQGYKNSAEYVLERHLRREEALKLGSKIVRYFTTGKGENTKEEAVYRRRDIVSCKTVESWHKEGRAVKEGEQPLKMVPMRAVTVTRKREIEEREREEGGKVKQGLYAKSQTDWIIPDPIQDGKIPRNAFGNIDVYVPTMIPKGAVHIPLKGTARVCKKLGVDFAEACTGFEFGKQRAVPVLTGVVVAAENEELVIDAWEADEVEKARKERDKREALVLGMWKKFFVGMRIVERMKREYGEEVEIPKMEKPVMNAATKKSEWETFQSHSGDFEGGFLREEAGLSGKAVGGSIRDDEGNGEGMRYDKDMAGGFVLSSQEEDAQVHSGLTIDHGERQGAEPGPSNGVAEAAYRTPISLHAAHQKPAEEEMDTHDEGFEVADKDKDTELLDLTSQSRSAARSRPHSQPSRGRSRGRGGKRASTARVPHSAAISDGEEESLLLDDLSSASITESEGGEEIFSSARKRKITSSASTSTRTAPKRKAARTSEVAVRSHFFAHGSDEETDAPLSQKNTKGGGKGRGRGRGRGKKPT